ncbi:MAG: RNA polymerase sigma-70 factor, partial [Cyclobacteriaceae bacterium]
MGKLTKHTDKELVLCLRHGDMAAFDELYFRYAKKLMAFSLTFFSNRDLAEEAVQEIFVRVWERRKKLDECKSFKTYLFQSVKFYMYNYIRDKKQNQRIEEVAQEEFLKPCKIEDNMVFEELEVAANMLISKLPTVQQQVFRLNKLEGKSPDEIGFQLNLSKRTIEHHIYLATKTLRKELSQHISL